MSIFKDANSELLKPLKKAKGGVKLNHSKNTNDCADRSLIPADRVTVLMNQHIGAPANCLVKKGDSVKIGDIIGDSDSAVFAPIHASVSGEVADITDILLPNGTVSKGVVILSDGKMEEREFKAPEVSNVEELIKATRDSGLVGLGGAGFPTHIKFTSKSRIDTIIINGAECEPYITADYREIMENSWDIMSGVYTLLDILKPDKIIIAIEKNKPKAIEELLKISSSKDDIENKVRIMKLNTLYPQGAEKVLIKTVTGRTVPKGSLPSDVGCMVINITSIAFLGRYLKTGRPLVQKRITVDGSAIKNPGNVIVPIGTPVGEVIDFCGGFKETPAKILLGGPMMGTAISNISIPIAKSNNAILAFTEKDVNFEDETNCIRCARCVDACPMNLMPTKLQSLVIKNDLDALSKADVLNCMECGSCAFVCPAKRNIVQYIRLGKMKLRKAGKK